jgi:uncharacterized protein YbjT (DUF2867 family)
MPTTESILVTGAGGQLGSRIAKQLTAQQMPLRLLARDPQKLAGFPNAESVQGDYGDIASLDRAFEGVAAAFIVSGYAPPGERAQLHRNAFQAARRAGVRYLIYLSFLGASPDSLFPMSRDHYQSEQFLQETGVPYTILQDSFYAELSLQMFNEEGILKGPGGEGKVSWVGREEIAEAIAKLLLRGPQMLGTFPLTGPSALSLEETADVLGSVTDRSLRYEQESLEEARAWRSQLGAPAWEVDTWIGSYDAIAANEVAAVDPALATILGRPASNLRTYFSARPFLWK